MTACRRDLSTLPVTARQVGYWIDPGWLAPVQRGSGEGYRFTDTEWRVVVDMARLVAAGLTPQAAHTVARAGGSAEIGAGVTVVVDGAAA